jgi:IclR family mhp operon transcriptional activator
VRSLSVGFDDEEWVTQIAKPFISELCREIVWPVSIATLSGTAMMVRETTDHSTPLGHRALLGRLSLPLLTPPPAAPTLAFCPAPQRETLIEISGPLQQGRGRRQGG